MPSDLKSTALAAQAEAPGPWKHEARVILDANNNVLMFDPDEDAAPHIAAWSPVVALEHLARIEELERALVEACDLVARAVAVGARGYGLRDRATVDALEVQRSALRAKAARRG